MKHRIESEDLELMLKARPEIWDALVDSRIFLTGATGFFGIWMLTAFQYAKEKGRFRGQILALSRNPESFLLKYPEFRNADWLKFCQGDVLNFTFPEVKVDYIIHAATEASVSLNLEKPLYMYQVASEGTRRVLDFAVQAEAKRFLLTSSGAVYGNQPSEISHLPETYPGAPDVLAGNAAYGEGKRVAEMYCNFYQRQYGLESIIARCYAFAGPHLPLDSHFAIGNFVRDLLAGGPLRIAGDGSPYRSYLYAADLVVWLLTALTKGLAGEAYNIGSDADLDIHSLAEKVISCETQQISILLAQHRQPDKPVSRYVPLVDKAKKDLNLEIFTPLESAIKKMIVFHKTSILL